MHQEEEHARAPAVKLSPELARLVDTYVHWKRRRSPPALAEDIMQTAVVVALAMQSPTFRDLRRHVGRAVNRAMAPVSLPVDGGARAELSGMFVAVTVDAIDFSRCNRVTPEDRVAAAQILARWRVLKAELAEAEARAVGELPETVRELGARVRERRTEAYARERKDKVTKVARGVHVELAQQHGITAKQVSNAVVRYERALDRSGAVVELRGAMLALRREARS